MRGGFLDLISQSDPGLRHATQSNFAPAIRKPLSDFEAMDGVQPVARYGFVGRHPHPQITKAEGLQFVPRPKEKTCRAR